jgi:hypothetical protein
MRSVSKHIVYGLVDPRTLLIRYVGKSGSGLNRPKTHRQPSRVNAKTHVGAWVRQLVREGLTYVIVTLEELPAGDGLNDAEIWWIAFGRACGWPLTNLTTGGEGLPGHEVSSETREKISSAQRGRPLAPEHCAALSEGAKRRWETEDREAHAERARARAEDPVVRERLSRQARDYYSDPAMRVAQSERVTRSWESLELRERQRVSHLGHKHSDEHRAKIAEGLRGDQNPAKKPEAREKIRLSKLDYWARRRAEGTAE